MDRDTETPDGRPLDVFVHIPKTAGSTLNNLLLRHHARRRSPHLWPLVDALVPDRVLANSVAARWLSLGLARGCPHLGLFLSQPRVFDRILRRADWVSAHIPLATMAAHAERLGRPARFFTVIRDPVEQIASHYQWCMEIHERGPVRFYRYAGFFRGLSERVRATDNSDPRQIIAILTEHRTLFLNLQTTYLFGRRPKRRHFALLGRALDRLTAFGVDGDVSGVFQAMTGAPMPHVGRLNRSRSSFDRGVFYSDEMQAFLRDRHSADLALYDLARARSGRADGAVTPPPASSRTLAPPCPPG